MSDSISEVFDVAPIPRREITVPTPEIGKEISHDAEYAAGNIRKLIEVGMNSLQDADRVASSSEAIESYEVVAKMLKTLTDMNLQLMELHNKTKAVNQTSSDQNAPGSVTNNAFFVGTTKELNDLIASKLK